MKYCSNCGDKIVATAAFCQACGTPTGLVKPKLKQAQSSPIQVKINKSLAELDTGIFALSFIFPPIGLIIYLSTKGQQSVTAMSAARGSLYGASFYGLATLIYVALD